MLPDILTLSAVLLLCLATIILLAAFLMARSLIQPPRMTDGKAAWVLKRLSPADLNLPFDCLWFDIRDQHSGQLLKYAAWWIPHPNAHSRTALLVHGYADAKVGSIAFAPLFHSLGYNILAIDLRAHGESSGRYFTAGFHEQHDLNQVINQLRADRPNETQHLVLFGLSLGAAVVAAASVHRHDLAAVILDSPAADEAHAIHIHFNLLGLPGPFVQRLALQFAQWITHADFSALRPIDLIPKIPCPLLIIHPQNDVYVPPADSAALQSAANSRPPNLPTSFWLVPNTPHLLAFTNNPPEYHSRLKTFLDTHLPPA